MKSKIVAFIGYQRDLDASEKKGDLLRAEERSGC
jgi:hypothetical protein